MLPSETTRKRPFAWSLLAALVIFVIFWKTDFPKPWFDDLFYNGAPIHMAEGGDFSNPLLVRQEFPSRYFFVYPPFHAYAVYAWLSVFGISASSLLAFHDTMFFIMTAAMIFVLRRFDAPEWLSWIVPLSVTTVFFKFGLRPEAFSVAMTMTGFAVMLYCRKAGFWLWLAVALILSGTIAAPRTVFFGAALILLGGWRLFGKPGVTLRSLCVITGLAFAAVALLFLVFIHFRLAEFYQTFHLHSRRIGIDGGVLVYLGKFMSEFGVRSWPLLALILFLGVVALRRRGGCVGESGWVCYGLAGALVLTGLTKGLEKGGPSWYLHVIFLLLAAGVLKGLSRSRARIMSAAIVLALLSANSNNIIEIGGLLTGHIRTQPPENREAVLALRPTKEHPVMVDVSVARYVFDYKLPPGCVNYEFGSRFPGVMAYQPVFQPEDVYVLGPLKVHMLFHGAADSGYPDEKWSFLGRACWSQYSNPCKASVITARECMDFFAKNSGK